MALGKRTKRSLFSTPRKSKKTKRSYTKSGSGPVIPWSLRTKGTGTTIKVTRMVEKLNVNVTTGADQYTAMEFKLSDLPSYTDFTNTFDEYKIEAIKLWFVPTHNSSTLAATGGKKIPFLLTAVDNDDSATPFLSSILQRESCKNHGMFDQMRVRSFAPAASMQVYNGATTGYGPYQGWLDTASPDIVHYGCKFAVIGIPITDEFRFYVYATYYVSLRKIV